MTIQIQVKEELSQLEQFAKAFNVPIKDNKAIVPSYLGDGFIKQYNLPYQIKAYHYFYNLKTAIYVESINHESDGLYMFQINLSNLILTKSVTEQEKNLSAQGKCGVLYYSPGNPSRGCRPTPQLQGHPTHWPSGNSGPSACRRACGFLPEN